jgi:hypothetical protein
MDRREYPLENLASCRRIGSALSLAAMLTVTPAAAQGWFDQFFQPFRAARPAPRRFYAPAPYHRPPRLYPRTIERSFVERPVEKPEKPPEKIGKDVTEITVVLGDSLGQMLGTALTEVFADKASIGVLRRARENTGLTRDDVFDWVKGTRDLLAGPDKIKAAAFLVGSNDRQPIREGDNVYEPFSPKWTELYRARVAAIVGQFKAHDVPLVWVGLPVVRSDRLAADFSKLNDI